MMKPKDYWLSQANMARAFNVSLSAFQKWNVRPAAKIGRCVYYSPGDVTANRLDNKVFGPGSELAKINPGIAELVRERIGGLESKIRELREQARGEPEPV